MRFLVCWLVPAWLIFELTPTKLPHYTLPTYGAVTARSYHPGGLNSLLLDGSVRFIKSTIALPVWRALGTKSCSPPIV